MTSSPHTHTKQRREIRGGSAVFVDQAPVRAAVEGRVLLLDGVEKAERNVLPLLNSLLENREMPLEDGRFLLGAKGARACFLIVCVLCVVLCGELNE